MTNRQKIEKKCKTEKLTIKDLSFFESGKNSFWVLQVEEKAFGSEQANIANISPNEVNDFVNSKNLKEW